MLITAIVVTLLILYAVPVGGVAYVLVRLAGMNHALALEQEKMKLLIDQHNQMGADLALLKKGRETALEIEGRKLEPVEPGSFRRR
jgi:hypothetical protein